MKKGGPKPDKGITFEQLSLLPWQPVIVSDVIEIEDADDEDEIEQIKIKEYLVYEDSRGIDSLIFSASVASDMETFELFLYSTGELTAMNMNLPGEDFKLFHIDEKEILKTYKFLMSLIGEAVDDAIRAEVAKTE